MEIFKLFGSIFIENDKANQSLETTDKKTSGLMGTLGKLGGIVAGAFAVDKIIDFGRSSVEAAANAQAMNAQFDQVFGEIGDAAQKTIDGLGDKFGMVPNRIKPAMTQMTSMFKGLGMDTETAMGTAEDAVTLVADAAAFYDKSFEDANSALNSFIKGNYEGGEAIGLFGNETQLASWASENLGLKWSELDEKGKQVARLEFAKAMQESAGATGQAARESDSYQNQLGNLKQVWTDLKAKIAGPILEPAVKGLKLLAEWIGKIDTEPIAKGFEFIKGAFSSYADYVKSFFSGDGNLGESFMRIFNSIKDVALLILQDAFAFVKEQLDKLKAFWDENGASIISAVQNVWTIISTIIDFAMTYVIKPIIENVWGAIKSIFSGALDVIMGLVKIFSGLFTGDWSLMWEGVKQIISGIASAIWGIIQNSFLGDVINTLINFKDRAVEKFNELKDKALTKFREIKENILSPIREARDKVEEIVGKIKGFFTGLSLKLPNISTPHFKLKNWSKNPLDWVDKMPYIAVDWYAKGTNYADGGLAVVGEQGPELINLPRGSQVSTAAETRQMTGNTFNFERMLEGATFIIREETDIKKVAKELYDYTRMAARSKGVVMG